MLTVDQISGAVADVSVGRLALDEFERWIRRESRNMHSWADGGVIDAVMSVEAVLSEWRFADMPDALAKQELANAIRPFVQTARKISGSIPQDHLLSSESVKRKGPHSVKASGSVIQSVSLAGT